MHPGKVHFLGEARQHGHVERAIENGNEKLKIIMQEGAVISLDFKILLVFDEVFKILLSFHDIFKNLVAM